MPVQRAPSAVMVGAAMRRRLARDGITMIGELARLDEGELVARYGKIGRRLHLCARGEDDRPVDPDREAKSMSTEITLDEDGVDEALDAVREKFGDDAIVRGRGFGTKLVHQGPSKAE